MKIERTCEHCRQGFHVTREREAARKYCSPSCRKTHEIENGRLAARVTPVSFICQECSKPFTMVRSNVTAYRKKFGKDPMYCSIPCSSLGRRRDADENHKTNCKNCGKEFYKTRRKGSGTIYREQILCSKQCKREWTSKLHREKHGIPEISRRIKRGYVVLRIPPRDGNPPFEILEHRYNMEQKLGRPLRPNETIHHKFGNKQDNDPERLELWSKNHGPGQRVTDQVQFAIEILTLYPEFCIAAGYSVPEKLHATVSPP